MVIEFRAVRGGSAMARIVVGVDASPGSADALAWAAGEAGLRRATLHVVHAYHSRDVTGPEYVPTEHGLAGSAVSPALGGYSVDPAAGVEATAAVYDRSEFESAARSRADEILSAALYPLRETLAGIEVERVVIDDRHPAEALVEASRDADLLVVGSRGRGGFRQLLLGSVSHAAVLHAVCPVVVVPGQER
jgi:nucleotide-binding universal stress UspA family protein